MLSQTLKRLRENIGYTQQQVANALGIDRSTYTYYETGKTTPDIKTIFKLVKIFNVSISELLESEDREKNLRLHDVDPDWYSNYDVINFEHIYELTKKEKTLISLYRTLSEERQKNLLQVLQTEVDTLSKKKNKLF